MKNYNLCVVGAGNWGSNHIKTLKKLGSLGGVVDSNLVILSKIKKKISKLLNIFKLG